MHKIFPPALALGLALTSCSVFKRSRTWETVIATPQDAAPTEEPSKAYAVKVHRALAARNVEHKVVTYRFHYINRLNEEAIGSRSSVIYRDDTDAANPWWIADGHTGRPVWLPNGSEDTQVSYFLRRRAEIVALRPFPGGDASKTAMNAVRFRPAPVAQGPEYARLFRARHGTEFDPDSVLDRHKMALLRNDAHPRGLAAD